MEDAQDYSQSRSLRGPNCTLYTLFELCHSFILTTQVSMPFMTELLSLLAYKEKTLNTNRGIDFNSLQLIDFVFYC